MLTDKFNIIENHINTDTFQSKMSKIESYFENYLNTNIKVLNSEYIHQFIWFENNNASINIETLINVEECIRNYLIQHRNQIKKSIKKDCFELSNFNSFIKNFIDKLEHINDIFKSSQNKIMIEGIKLLSNLIISDSFIFMFFENNICELEKNKLKEINKLVYNIKKVSFYYNFQIYYNLLTIFGHIFVKKMMNSEDLPLPNNIKNIQKINNMIKYYQQIKEYFSFIGKDFIKIGSNIDSLIISELIEIIKNNSLNEVEYLFNNIQDFLQNITIDEAVINDIIILIIQTLKPNSENNITNIFKISNIFNLMTYIFKPNHIEIIKQKINVFITDEIIDKINIKINMLIKSNNTFEAIKLLNFTKFIDNKDVFLLKYYKYLTQRLMEKITGVVNYSTADLYFKIEKKIVENLKIHFDYTLIYKISKVLLDAILSYEYMIQFNKNHTDNKMVVMTTSYNNWDINLNEGIVTKNMINDIQHTQLGKHLMMFENDYVQDHPCKMLSWYPHFGEVDITYLDKNIRLLPIQFMVLEMFNDTNQLNIQLVLNAPFFKNYTTKFINDIINSLISSNLIKIKQNELFLNETNNFNSNLIEVFFNISDYGNIWEQQRNHELILSREEIICANINHIIKLNPLTRDELFINVSKLINVFKLDQTLFDKSIQHMINMDYIRLNEGKYEKIFY